MNLTIPPLMARLTAWNSVLTTTPFTTRDGDTYLLILKNLYNFVNTELIGHLEGIDGNLAIEFANIAGQIDDLLNTQTGDVDAKLADITADMNAAVAQVVNNSIELQDSVMAGVIRDTSSETFTELNGSYPVYRIWEFGTGYPARIPGAVNVFFGPEDPGLIMAESDYWANANLTTLAEVVSQMETYGTPANNAARLAASALPFIVLGAEALSQDPADSATFSKSSRGASPNQHLAWGLNATGVCRLYGSFIVPEGWSKARLDAYYYHNGAASDAGLNAFFTVSLTGFADGLPITSGVSNNTSVAAKAPGVVTMGSLATYDVTPGQMVSIMFARNANASQDTLEVPINFLGFRVRRFA